MLLSCVLATNLLFFESDKQAMNTRKTDVQEASADASLLAKLAELDVELAVALYLQQDLREVSNFAWNALTDTDALIEREKSLKLIERLEAQSKEADALKTVADALVKDLRAKKRSLTRKLKTKAFSSAMEFARQAAQTKANAAMQAAASEANKKAAEPPATQKNAKTVEAKKPQQKRKLEKSA
jgi:hypothetical protein